MMGYLVLVLAFFSGFNIMTIELLGGRILAPYFGGSVYVWGSIITVFMLALSIGYLIGGKWSLNQPSLKRHGMLFFVSSILILPIGLFSESMMEFVFAHIEDPRYGSLSASMLLFFLPTTFMGMIAPYSVRLMVTNSEHSGHKAGFLYFVSTLGSALGTLATSFYLVLWFEINQIIYTVAACMFAGGGIAIGYHFLINNQITVQNKEQAHEVLS
jgi:predicted membrane-bound spermidine synthase